jgi:polyprenyldihydroxybenzoate methyltransferase / 3-demethylubiquinol 3-O-methyltransferase
MNPLRHSFLSQCLASTTPSAANPQQKNKLHLLDVGCGGGIFAESAARLPHIASVTAIDPSPEVLRVAKAHRRQDPVLAVSAKDGSRRLTYIQASVFDDAVLDHNTKTANEQDGGCAGFDVVSIFEVLEHVPNPSAFLARVEELVKPGGWVVASTIARTWTSWFVTKVVAEDVLRMVPPGTHDWNKYINERELREWFMKRGGGRMWERPRAMGVVYVPGLGWREVPGGEDVGNYFFGIRKAPLRKGD